MSNMKNLLYTTPYYMNWSDRNQSWEVYQTSTGDLMQFFRHREDAEAYLARLNKEAEQKK